MSNKNSTSADASIEMNCCDDSQKGNIVLSHWENIEPTTTCFVTSSQIIQSDCGLSKESHDVIPISVDEITTTYNDVIVVDDHKPLVVQKEMITDHNNLSKVDNNNTTTYDIDTDRHDATAGESWLEKIVLMTYGKRHDTNSDSCLMEETENKNGIKSENNTELVTESVSHSAADYSSNLTQTIENNDDINENNDDINVALHGSLPMDHNIQKPYNKNQTSNHVSNHVSNHDDDEESKWEQIDYPIVGLSIFTRTSHLMDDISEEATSTSSTTLNIDEDDDDDDNKFGMGESNHTTGTSSLEQIHIDDVPFCTTNKRTTEIKNKTPSNCHEDINNCESFEADSCIDHDGVLSSDSVIIDMPEQENNFLDFVTKAVVDDHFHSKLETPNYTVATVHHSVVDVDNNVITKPTTLQVNDLPVNKELDSRSDHHDYFESNDKHHTYRTNSSPYADLEHNNNITVNDLTETVHVSDVKSFDFRNSKDKVSLQGPEILHFENGSIPNTLPPTEALISEDIDADNEIMTIITQSYTSGNGNLMVNDRESTTGCPTSNTFTTVICPYDGEHSMEKDPEITSADIDNFSAHAFNTTTSPDCQLNEVDTKDLESKSKYTLSNAAVPLRVAVNIDFDQGRIYNIRYSNPLVDYEISKVVGISNIGSFAVVQMRGEISDDSSNIVTATKGVYSTTSINNKMDIPDHQCFQIPLFGTFWRSCINAKSMQNQSFVALEHSEHVSSIYNTEGELVRSSNDSLYAMKAIHLSRLVDEKSIQELKHEVEVLKELDHAHIVQVFESYEYMKQIFVVMEFCTGGNLYSRDPYSESEAAVICKSILSAVDYMHSKGMYVATIQFFFTFF
jgi:Protein kinase domain